MKLPEPDLEVVLPFIEKARGFLEKGESLSPIAFVGNFASGRLIPVVINTASDEAKDWQRDLCRQLEDGYWDKIRASGVSEINDDVDKAAFMAATKGVWAMFEEKLGKHNIEAIVNVQ